MNINITLNAKRQLKKIKSIIQREDPERAEKHIRTLINGLKKILEFLFIGKVNDIYNTDDIREVYIEGHKVLYHINENDIFILTIYKDIIFEETNIYQIQD